MIALDLAEGMLREARTPPEAAATLPVESAADAAALPLRDASVDLVFSNLMLQWCQDPDAVFGECRRVLKPGGLLTFTTFGPDTLVELRRAWAAADDAHARQPVHRHARSRRRAGAIAGLAEPVMDVERFTRSPMRRSAT